MDNTQSTGTSGEASPEIKLHNGCLIFVQDNQLISRYGKIPDSGPVMSWNDLTRYLDNVVPGFRETLSAVVFQLQGTGARSGP